jgi:thiol-disulfide isomerase/thioredoxin
VALTQTQFQAGMTTNQYVDQIKVNKDPFIEIYHAVEIPQEVNDFFGGLAEQLKLAVITADWCGDALSTTPTILKLAESIPNISHQVFNRDDDVPMADSLLPENRAGTVPIFAVFDQDMNEVALFIETADGLVPQIDAMDEMVERETESESESESRVAKRGKRTAHRVAHARDWGEVILREFGQVVAAGLSIPPVERPAMGGTKWPAED